MELAINAEQLHWLQMAANNSDPNCTLGVQWIYHVFEQCVTDARHYAAVISGIVSIVAWALFGMPQIIENIKSGQAHIAMSIYLLLFWTLGDIMNLIGCIMTGQLELQKYMAAFAILVDIVMIGQWLLAYLRDYRLKRRIEFEVDVNEHSPLINERMPVATAGQDDASVINQRPGQVFACIASVWLLTCGASYSGLQSMLPAAASGSSSTSARRLLFYQPVFVDTEDIVGYIIGCLSSCFYLSARVPQLARNCIRRSTEGLSAGLFILATTGNLTYGAQIFLTDSSLIFIIRHFPWILGSLGVSLLDLVMLTQFVIFRGMASEEGGDNS